MIVDLHTRIWTNPGQLGPELADQIRRRLTNRWPQFDANPSAHEQAMTCVDCSVILGFCSGRMDACIPNEVIASYVARDPQRRIGLAGIDPLHADADDQLDAALAMGLAGIVVSPALQGFHPTHSSAMRLFERCAELEVPVCVTLLEPLVASAELEFARPIHWDEVARNIPSLRIVIGQLGHPWINETLAVIDKHPHVFSDISSIASRPWELYDALLRAQGHGVMNKLMFGSGFPYDTPAKTIEALYSINSLSQGSQLPSISRSQIHGIVERDALALLGLDSYAVHERRSVEASGQWRTTAGTTSDGAES